MANRVKEDEKNERIIRGLLKLAENRRCINCNSMGPQYVCTNFWTFVCTTCSGIHREFTHRVKSVSMAKFTSQEVSSLQGGGNARAKEIYFKEWDPQRHSVPDSSNVERLRDFIKHVYVDRRYTGERSFDKPPRVKMVDKEDSYSYRSGSRSPPYEDKYGDYRRSPARFEVPDDRHRDDRSGNRRSEDSRFSDGEHKLEGRSPNHQKELGSFSPPLVRPVRDILGENIPPLRVGEPPKTNGGRATDGSAHTQRTASSSSMGSIDGNSVELTRANPGSLIDFSADPEPPAAAAAPQTQQTSPSTGHSITQPTISSIDGGNWASFDFPTQEKESQATSNANTLDSVISQLSVPAAAPVKDMPILPVSGGAIAAHVDNMPMLSAGGAPAAALASNMPILPPVGSAPAPGGATSMFPISGGSSFIKVNDVGQWPSMQHPQHSLFPTTDSRSTAQQITSSVGGTSNNNSWSSSLVSNAQGSLSTPTLQSSQPVSNPGHDFSSGVVSMPLPLDANSSGRKELPEGLFTATYPSVPVPVPGWQAVPPRGMGFGMQYPAAALQHMQTFPQSSKSANPFDLNNESTLVHLTFPSMASLQGALPNVSAPTGLLRTSSFGTPSAQWMPPQSSSYALVMPPQPPSYTLAIPPSAYMGQQIPSNLTPLGHQGAGVFGSDGAVFGTNTNQQLGGRFSAPATPSYFSSVGGNPFG